MKKQYLECGKIANTHGVRGAVLIESWCDSPAVLASLKTVYIEKDSGYTPLRVLSAAEYKGRVLATLEGLTTLEDAAAMKNRILFAARGDIPCGEGDFFIQDLFGLPVVDAESGKVYGKLSDVVTGAASDLYEVDTGHGKALIPAVAEFVKEIDPARGIFIHAIEGLFA